MPPYSPFTQRTEPEMSSTNSEVNGIVADTLTQPELAIAAASRKLFSDDDLVFDISNTIILPCINLT